MNGNHESTELPLWLLIAIIIFGLIFFVAHLIWMILKIRSARSRDKRIEYTGIIVPGLSGLIFAGLPWIVAAGFPRSLQVILLGMTFINMIIGRALYECTLLKCGILEK